MRIVLIVGGVLVAAILLVVIVGYLLPVKHQAHAEATYAASPETVFALISNVDGFTAWRSGLTTVEKLPSPDGRLRFRETSGQGPITFVVERSEPNRKLVTRIDDKSLPFGGTWTFEVEPAGAGRTTLRITEDGEVYNPVFRFVSRFFMGYDGTIKQYLAEVGKRLG